MDITQVSIPSWNGTNGNYNPTRVYYSGPNRGKKAIPDKIVCHWSDNTSLLVTDATFRDPNRKSSAHFAVHDTVVHQYVPLTGTSFNSGKGTVNCESVAIEHTGMPGVAISELTYQTSAELIVFICKEMKWTFSRDLLHPHHEFVPTQCPGTLDLDKLATSVSELLNQGVDQPLVSENVPPSTTASYSIPVLGEPFAPFLIDLQPSQVYSDEVKRMQKYLEERGHYFTDQGNNDGYYGPVTQRAVHDFQGQHGILSTTEYGWWYELTRAEANKNL